MSEEFFGIHLKPNKKYTNNPPKPILLTMVSYGEQVESKSRSCVMMKINGKEFTICVLNEGKEETKKIEVVIPAEVESSFRVTGPSEVHLTGRYIDAGEDSDESGEDFDGFDPDYLEALEQEEGEAPFIDYDFEGDSEEDEDFSEDEESEEEIGFVEEIEEEEVAPSQNSKKNKKKEEVKKAIEVEASNGKRKSEDSPSKQGKKEKKNGEIKKETSSNDRPTKNNKVKEEPKKAPVKEAPKVRKLPSGLEIEDFVVGEGLECKTGNNVSMRYVGKLTNGKIFDSNSSGKPFSFRLGAGQVIKGWDQGIVGMRVGGQRKLTIPPQLAYGKRGAPPDIPKNATLVFDVKLVDIKKK